MKYCPYCGIVLVDGAVSFCAECGKTLPVSREIKEKQEKKSPSGHRKEPEPLKGEQHGKKNRRRQNGKPHPLEKVKEKEADTPEERKPEPLSRPEQQPEPSAVTKSTESEDDYDGYYDDILPADEGRFGDGIDRWLVKKIALIIGVVFLIVGACVLMMYLL